MKTRMNTRTCTIIFPHVHNTNTHKQTPQGLFSNFERVQNMATSGHFSMPGVVHGGMLAQIENRQSGVDSYGIPFGGSLPGDNV